MRSRHWPLRHARTRAPRALVPPRVRHAGGKEGLSNYDIEALTLRRGPERALPGRDRAA